MKEDNKHLRIVLPLVTMAGLAVLTAILMPLAKWAFSATGFVTVLLLLMLMKDFGIIRGKAKVIVALLFFVGLYAVHGFTAEYARRAISPALTQAIPQQPQK